MDLMIKLPIFLVLGIIVFSLFEGMYYLAKDDGKQDKTRVVRALTVRIVLSFVLFSIIMAAHFFGWIEPNAIV